ncbi:MAG TPA: dihydropteroate synthase [Aquabacterium sp.]|nr:dihydropteroate synthase [Aquabacterium sp.]HRH29583.1 dihydropteroate synthase [Aquabacterium sp.]
MFWQTTRFAIDLMEPRIMGIVNVTPDSFSDGGDCLDPAAALQRCEQLIADGAHILDIGGESTRPGALTLSPMEEWRRLQPVLQVALTLGVPVSVDTCKTEVMARALDLGVDIINDIKALTTPGAEAAVVRHGQCGICLMHMQGDTPATMQQQVQDTDVVGDVLSFLQARVRALQEQGVALQRLTLDPGIGFGKSPEHNVDLMARQSELSILGLPWLLGWSRKSTLGVITGRPVEQRLAASLAAALACITRGASVIRVHDVAETSDALRVWQAAGLVPSRG